MHNLLDQLFHDGGRYHIETTPLIYGAKHWKRKIRRENQICYVIYSEVLFFQIRSFVPGIDHWDGGFAAVNSEACNRLWSQILLHGGMSDQVSFRD